MPKKQRNTNNSKKNYIFLEINKLFIISEAKFIHAANIKRSFKKEIKMSTQVQLTPNKTYATVENAIKAVEKKYPSDKFDLNQLRYMILTHTDGRFFPCFIGTSAMQYGVHFHFNIVA